MSLKAKNYKLLLYVKLSHYFAFFGQKIVRYLPGCHDTHHNDTKHNDIQHNDTQQIGLMCDTQHNNALPFWWVSLLLHYYAERHYAECRYAECRGAISLASKIVCQAFWKCNSEESSKMFISSVSVIVLCSIRMYSEKASIRTLT